MFKVIYGTFKVNIIEFKVTLFINLFFNVH